VVQDPTDAEEPSMPQSAATYVEVDRTVPGDRLADTLIELHSAPIERQSEPEETSMIQNEHDVSLNRDNPMEKLDRIGKPSKFACPDCDGVLWELSDAKPVRFRCHTGHAFTLRTLTHTQATKAEDTMWAALRALQERTSLLQRLATAYGESDNAEATLRFQSEAMELKIRADAIYDLIATKKVRDEGYEAA
jgi:two-component system chemotaxis response regulator CheB